MKPIDYVTYYVEYLSPQESMQYIEHYDNLSTEEKLINDVRDELYKIEIFKSRIEIAKAVHDKNYLSYTPTYKLHETIGFSYNTLCDIIFDKYNPQKLNGKIRIISGGRSGFNIEINAENLSIIHTEGDFAHDKYKFGRAIDSYCNKFLFSKITYNNYNL